MAQKAMAQKRTARRAPAKATMASTPALEWIVAALGLVMLAGVIAVLLADAVAGGGEATPAITVSADAVTRTPTGWVVEFQARNGSHEPAAEVPVTGTLTVGGADLETRTVTLDYLPGGGVSRGGLLFRNDPAGGTLELSADGYRAP